MSVERKEEEKAYLRLETQTCLKPVIIVILSWLGDGGRLGVVLLLHRLRPSDVFLYRWSGDSRGGVSVSSSLSSS